MTLKRLVLTAMLAAATGFLALSLVDRADERAPMLKSGAAVADEEAREAGVRPGRIIWASWREREQPRDPGLEPGAMKDLEPRVRRKVPEEARRRLEESFQGMDVYLPEGGR